MEKFDQRKALRTQFVKELFELTDGNENNFVPTSQVAERLGLDYNDALGDFEEVFALVWYLEEENLVAPMGNRKSQVRLTHKGVLEIERAIEEPDRPTEHLASFNQINVGTMIHGQIQQASPGATQSQTILGHDEAVRLRALVRDLRSSIEDVAVEGDDRAVLEADITTLEAQANSPEPKKDVVRPSLQSAKRILETTASGVAVHHIIQAIDVLLATV